MKKDTKNSPPLVTDPQSVFYRVERRRFTTLDAATAYAGALFRKDGIVRAITAGRKDLKGAA